MAEETPTSFTFSFLRAAENERDVAQRLSALQARLDTLTDKVRLGGAPIILALLGLSRDPEQLRALGKALPRVADVIAEMDRYQELKAVLAVARERPMELLSMAGDFGGEVDNFLTTEWDGGE